MAREKLAELASALAVIEVVIHSASTTSAKNRADDNGCPRRPSTTRALSNNFSRIMSGPGPSSGATPIQQSIVPSFNRASTTG